MPKSGNSYGQILKSSSIIGGAQGINYLIGMVRTKMVAILLGPSGVGLVGLYTSATELVGTVAGLGIASSGVREVAEAHGGGNQEHVARTVQTLRRVCWATGIIGWILAVALSYPLSIYTFGSGERAWAIALLGATILIGAVSGGQSALIQGTRRIGDLARMGVFGAISATMVAVCLYAWLGEKGIIPVLILTAAVNLGFSWWFASKIQLATVSLTWGETLRNSKRLIHLGTAFMYGAILALVVGLTIRSVILKHYGLDANGIYQAAWAISGMFAGFILNAMGTDFYPRLTAVASDNEKVNRLVSEQIEVGILFALPGLLGTLSFAPWIMHLLYSAKFLPGAEMLPWLAVGVFGQVITFPLGFIQRAKGRAGWIYVSQTHLNALHLVLAVILIRTYGVTAAAWAFAATTYLHGIVVFCIARRLSNFSWTAQLALLILTASGIIGAGFAAQMLAKGLWAFALGSFLTTGAVLFSLRGISSRLGESHRIVQFAMKFPGGRLACGF
ncbi:MAG: O-antigen translocase [Verrucomicrobia bacterium]|nr:O-antigen translocase [Verrucomicrobiota bacterium]